MSLNPYQSPRSESALNFVVAVPFPKRTTILMVLSVLLFYAQVGVFTPSSLNFVATAFSFSLSLPFLCATLLAALELIFGSSQVMNRFCLCLRFANIVVAVIFFLMSSYFFAVLVGLIDG